MKATQWQSVELELHSQTTCENPFLDVRLTVDFVHEGGRAVAVPGFWDGGDTWKARFAPTEPGEWSWRSRCSNAGDGGLNGHSGAIRAIAPDGEAVAANPNHRGFLRVSGSGRYFEYADGTPFFWLGDTLWFLYTARCDEKTVLPRYIADRKAKGFTVVQVVAGRPGGGRADAFWGMDRPHWFQNEAGEPFVKRFDRINPDYFKLLDRKIAMLLDAGLAPCIMGCWGWDMRIGLDAAKRYWEYLIARYASYNVIWSGAGEYFFTEDEQGWRELGRHIKRYDPYGHPLSMHSTAPHSGSRHYHREPWYDFNMPQVGHVLAFRQQIEQLPLADYRMDPPKPSVMAESWYENHPNCEGSEPGRISAADIRFAAYVSMLQGCVGQTYGAHGIWNLHEPSDDGLWDDYHRPDPWRQDLDLPGSRQMGYLRDAFSRVDWPRLEPMPGNIATPQLTHGYLAGVPGRCCIAYVTGKRCDVMLILPVGTQYQGQWMNPATGQWQECDLHGSPYGNWMRWSAATPADGDWVLVAQAAT